MAAFLRTAASTSRASAAFRNIPVAHSRVLSSSAIVLNTTTSFASKHRKGLYYHPHPDGNSAERYAVSFLDTPSSYPDSATNLGYVPLSDQDHTGKEQEEELFRSGDSGPIRFSENSQFLRLLHAVLSQRIEESQSIQQLATMRAGEGENEGYVHIIDQRNLPPANRAGDSDDIIASVLARNGKIVPHTYEESLSYRTFNKDGLMQLPEDLQDILLDGLRTARSIE